MGMTARRLRHRISGGSASVGPIVAATLVASVLSAPGSDDRERSRQPDGSDHGDLSPLDILAADVAPLAKRLGPIVGLAVAVLWLVRRRWR